MPISAPNPITRPLALTAATAALIAGAAVLPSSSEAASRPHVKLAEAFVNDCSAHGLGRHPVYAVFVTGPRPRSVDVTGSYGRVRLRYQGTTTNGLGRQYTATPQGLNHVGTTERLRIAIRWAHGTTTTTRTVRVSVAHICQG